MRFIIYILAIFTATIAKGDNFSDFKLTNSGVESARGEIISYDMDGFFEEGEKMPTLYVKPIGEWSRQGSTLSTKFTAPFKWLGRQQYIRLRGVVGSYKLLVNGEEVAHVMDGSALSEVDITKALKSDVANTISVELDNSSAMDDIEGWVKSTSQPIEEAYIFSQPTQMVRDITIEGEIVEDQINTQINVTVKSHALNSRTSTIYCDLTRQSGEVIASTNTTITQSMRGEESFNLTTTVPLEEAWNGESTNFLLLKIKVQHEGRNTEFQTYNVGIRDAQISKSGVLTVNGNEVKLKTKYIAHDFDAENIYEIKDQGFNAVVIGAGGYNRALYDACDREGLYVVSTAPINSSKASQSLMDGGNPTNDPRWRAAYEQRVERHIYTTRMHPSVVAYAIAEKSLNGYNLYESYLKAKEIAGSRAVIYLDGEGEWNSDKLELNLEK